MTLSWMQKVDDWLGTPLAWLLQWVSRRARCLSGDGSPGPPPRRLICTKFIGIGSVVLSLPMLKALKDAGVEVAFWSFKSQADFARMTGYVDHVWVIRPSLREFIPTLFRTLLVARKFKADAFIDMEPTANFSAILARMSGAPRRVGFMANKPRREGLFTHLVALTAGRHMADSCLEMARALGVPCELGAPLPEVPSTCIDEAHDFPARPARRRMVININTSDLGQYHRSWPSEHWKEVCHALLTDVSVELLFPGLQSERSKVDALFAQIDPGNIYTDRLINIAGRTTLAELMSVLKSAEVVISVDSGVMHLAAWSGAPLVGLFGPETPALYAPRSGRAKVIWAGLACSPCCTVATEKHTRCRDNQCMKRIDSGKVLLACRALLKEQRRRAERAA